MIRIPFTDFTGKFVYHCHILNHEDNGMMGLVEVVAPRRADAPGRRARAPGRPRRDPRGGAPPAAAPHARTWVLCPLAGGLARSLALPR